MHFFNFSFNINLSRKYTWFAHVRNVVSYILWHQLNRCNSYLQEKAAKTKAGKGSDAKSKGKPDDKTTSKAGPSAPNKKAPKKDEGRAKAKGKPEEDDKTKSKAGPSAPKKDEGRAKKKGDAGPSAPKEEEGRVKKKKDDAGPRDPKKDEGRGEKRQRKASASSSPVTSKRRRVKRTSTSNESSVRALKI